MHKTKMTAWKTNCKILGEAKMKIDSNRKLEFKFGRAFFEELNEGDINSLIYEDNPDFFTSEERHTGFELTQIYNETSNGKIRVHVEGSWDNLMKTLKESWDSKSLPGCHVRLHFREPTPISNRIIALEAEEIVVLVNQHLPEFGKSIKNK